MNELPFIGKCEHAYGLLYLIHSDVYGPLSINARGGFIYFIIFIDDHSRFGYLYLMRYKFEFFEKFREFKYEVEKQLGEISKHLDEIKVANT